MEMIEQKHRNMKAPSTSSRMDLLERNHSDARTLNPPSLDCFELESGTTHSQESPVDKIQQHDSGQTEEPSVSYPSTKKATIIILGLYLAVFVVALDRTILGTAIPQITDEFQSFADIGWYQSAYMLTTAGLQLVFGKIYTFYSPKWTLVTAIAIFEIGSATSGAAPSSSTVIVGRAISGIGSAGMFSGSMVIMFNVLPLEKRPVFLGLFSAIFAIASVIGPLLGGVFTKYVSWRWCFYINLPIGAVSVVILLTILRQDFAVLQAGASPREKLLRLDPLGTLCFFASLVCLLLALQWGGSTYAWNNGLIIALLVLFVLLLVAFGVLQMTRPENRVTIPVRLLKKRSVLGAAWYSFFTGAILVVLALYIPIWFQAIQGVNAVQSGLRTIPTILAMAIFTIVSGGLIQAVGYYAPFMILGAVIMPIGAGLCTTWHIDSNASKWIGYQVVVGIGMGFGVPGPNIAAQTVLDKKDAALGVSLVILCQTLGGAVFAAVAQSVINGAMIQNLTNTPIPGISPSSIVTAGATDLRNMVPSQYLTSFLLLYHDSVMKGFTVAVGASSVLIIGAVMMEWASTKARR